MNDTTTILERDRTGQQLDALAKGGSESTSIVPAGVFGAPAERVFGAQPVAVHRDEGTILQKIKVMAAAAGDDWYYRFPVKNKDGGVDYIEGPSIKCANNVSRLYGNCDIDTRAFDVGPAWMFYARFMDLETGYSLVRPFQQRKSQKVMKTDAGRAEDIAFQIGASKAIRNVICNAIEFFTAFAWQEARQSIIDRVGKNLEVYRTKVRARLDEMKIDIKRVEIVRGRPFAQWIATDVALTIAEIQAINDGMATTDETYPAPAGAEATKEEAAAKDLGAKLDNLANGGGATAAGEKQNGAAGSGSASSGGEASQSASPSGASPASTTEKDSPQGVGSPAADKAAPDQSQAGPDASPGPSGAAEGGKGSETAAVAADAATETKTPKPADKVPTNEAEYRTYCESWFGEIGNTLTSDGALGRWKAEKTLRNKANVGGEIRDELKEQLDAIIAERKAR